MESKLRVQDYLSFGYLFLLILGIVKDAVYYQFLGINIIEYSSILDVLLSPVSYLTDKLTTFIVITLIIALLFFVLKKLPGILKKYRGKKWTRLFNDADNITEYRNSTVFILAIMLTFFYLGAGVGGGLKASKMMKNNEYKMKETIHFIDGSKKNVKILGQNSSFVFYVKKGDTNLSISPINGTIKVIENGIK